ncbi:MAG: hypothetical protein RQ751_11660 [Longimicrobiales bacterium]|nr:hypothetical protein [Longimicrobiales bacterium]
MSEQIASVKVVDFDMPFGRLLVFMVKVGLASIPAVVILLVVAFMIAGFFAGTLGTL